MEIVAKKFREQYVREAIYPDVKIYLNSLRERTLDDTLQNLHKNAYDGCSVPVDRQLKVSESARIGRS